MPSDERERQFERALQRHLRAEEGEAACPDAETLAAYHERTLILEELTKWKEHISHCLRCQETLAALEETSAIGLEEWQENRVAHPGTLLAAVRPAGSAGSIEREGLRAAALNQEILSERPLRRFSRANSWRWVVPAGALAAGLILFVVVRENRTSTLETAKSQMAQNRANLPRPAESPMIEQPLQSSPEKLAPPSQALSDLEDSRRAAQSRVNPQTALSRGPRNAREEKLEPGYVSPKGREAEERAKLHGQAALGGANQNAGHGFGNAPPPPAPRSPDAGATAGENVAPKKKVQDRTNQTEQALSAIEQAEATRGAAAITRESSNAQATQASSEQLSMSGRVLVKVAESNPNMIVAPKGTYAWRVGAAGLIESSSDAGLNWKVQDSEVRSELTSGSAPSDKVCWVVGKAGTILLTKDSGKHWKQVISPLTEDLGGVRALDANHASIWNVGNTKSLETADGGLTWVPAANE